ncbi:uncharacterized protein LOC108887450 isoform X5 [Lates calcarifer]|uniref:Uncharacterized protein LOC108887450 isoform X5 n=1 Tax=Lates calcarifer TaxID=8187 RepID=A0AAJ7PTT4_LATCA|nr:uncharacterized protein LOC108887450 isoform X5 [Lates calcarifer]
MALMDYMSLFLIVMVQSTAAATPITSYLSVRLGDEVTLSCGTVKSDWPKCDRTTWNFTDSRNNKATVTLFELGKIHEEAKSKSDRLSVTENCSLVIKKVTDEDAGLYGCRTKQQGQDKNSRSVVHLSVVTMTEHEDRDQVTLNCSVRTHEACRYTVEWLSLDAYSNTDLNSSQSGCYATVTFLISHFINTSKSELLKCKVRDIFADKEQLFTFRPQSSGENADWWWLSVILAVILVVLLITAAALIMWIQAKGDQSQMDHSAGLRLNPAGTQSAPETSQDMADPEDGVSYASVTYIKKANNQAQLQGNDDEDNTVTYSTVKLLSSSAGASTGLSRIHATINNPNI